jgi:hypothetical protein
MKKSRFLCPICGQALKSKKDDFGVSFWCETKTCPDITAHSQTKVEAFDRLKELMKIEK